MFLRKQFGGVLALSMLAMAPTVDAAKKLEIDETKWISIGGGIRSSFTSMEDAAPSGSDRNNDFNLDSARIYLNGQITETIKFEQYDKHDGESGARDAGVMRSEGKEYVVEDGDVILFRFNV